LKDLEEDDNTLYEGRLTFLGIPLWKVRYTKKEWKKRILLGWKKNKPLEIIFDDGDEYDIY
jgi:hypothetical protein